MEEGKKKEKEEREIEAELKERTGSLVWVQKGFCVFWVFFRREKKSTTCVMLRSCSWGKQGQNREPNRPESQNQWNQWNQWTRGLQDSMDSVKKSIEMVPWWSFGCCCRVLSGHGVDSSGAGPGNLSVTRFAQNVQNVQNVQPFLPETSTEKNHPQRTLVDPAAFSPKNQVA